MGEQAEHGGALQGVGVDKETRRQSDVVEVTGRNDNLGVSDLVNKAMLVGNSPGPEPAKLVLEGLWFPQTRKRLTIDISDELGDAGMDLLVLRRHQ